MDLLSKIRRINRLLQKTAGHPVNFMEMAEVLSSVIEANIFVLSRKGKILGHAIAQEIHNDRLESMIQERRFPGDYTQNLLKVEETSSNLDVESSVMGFSVLLRDASSSCNTWACEGTSDATTMGQ